MLGPEQHQLKIYQAHFLMKDGRGNEMAFYRFIHAPITREKINALRAKLELETNLIFGGRSVEIAKLGRQKPFSLQTTKIKVK